MNKKNVLNTETIKCINCGAVNCEEKRRGVYKCNYCGTTFKYKGPESVDVDDVPEDNSLVGEDLYYFKPTVSKEEFFKRAIIYLGLKNFTPDDILTSTFEDVKMDYFPYLVMHVKYKAILKEAGSKKAKEVDSKRRILCQKMSKDVASEQEMQLLDKIDFLGEVDDSKELTKAAIKKLHIIMPTKEEIEEESTKVLLGHKDSYKNELICKATNIEHKVSLKEIYFVPEYYLEFTYKGQPYKVMSFANELKVVGDVPDDSKQKKQRIGKKIIKSYYPAIALSAFIIIYSIILATLRLKFLIPFQIVAIIASIAAYFLGILFEKKILGKAMEEIFNNRKEMLKEYFNRENIELSALDYDDMESYKGGM